MREIIITVVFSLPLGTIIGYFFSKWYENRLARSRTIEDVQITNFISDYRVFKECFISALQSLERKDISFVKIISYEFPKHDLAIHKIILELDGDRYDRLNKKWTEYKEVYEKWGTKDGPGSDVDYLLETMRKPELGKNFSGDKDTMEAMNAFLHDDTLNKRYLKYLIYDIIAIAKKY